MEGEREWVENVPALGVWTRCVWWFVTIVFAFAKTQPPVGVLKGLQAPLSHSLVQAEDRLKFG